MNLSFVASFFLILDKFSAKMSFMVEISLKLDKLSTKFFTLYFT